MEQKVKHIRKPAKRKGGNQFYKDNTLRKVETHCGAEVTDYDLEERAATAKGYKFFKYPLCPECLKKIGR